MRIGFKAPQKYLKRTILNDGNGDPILKEILVLEKEHMDFMEKTNRYYSLWLGEAGLLNYPFSGIRWIYSQQRNQIQTGYRQPFDIYIFCQSERTVISYGSTISREVDGIKRKIQTAKVVDEMRQSMVSVFGNRCLHSVKYVFDKPDKLRQTTSYARNLAPAHYPQFKDFFTTNNPGCKENDWLETYFMNLVERHLCCGIFVQDLLVSCTDAPDMPYMPEEVQELGIHTLKPYRGEGLCDPGVHCMPQTDASKQHMPPVVNLCV